MKLLKTGNTITVITSKGIITNTNCDDTLFAKIFPLVEKGDEEEVKRLLAPELCAEELKIVAEQNLVNNIESVVKKYPELFNTKDGALYREGINLSIPKEVALKYIQAVDKFENNLSFSNMQDSSDFLAIDNFWMWCSLNPNAESREDLFTFLQHHDMQITEQGMFLAYRRVVTVANSSDKTLVDFISNSYIKVKSSWKKNPKDYSICKSQSGKYELVTNCSTHSTLIGNLQELYLDLPNMVVSQFTDAHTHTMDYRIGQETRIERSEGNQSNQVSCSKGLHVASEAYDYSGFGDTAIVVAVNPMDVLAVPVGEVGKLRTCAFTPIAVLNEDEENKILKSGNYSDLLFDHYQKQVENLFDLVSENTPYELKINNILNISSVGHLDSILYRFSEVDNIISSRVTNI